jgi:acetyl-CoA carboxylase carboxyl transferase subunit beta
MAWFDSIKSPKLKSVKKNSTSPAATAPVGLWKKCTNCSEILQNTVLEESQQVCPFCQHHYRLGPWERLELLVDKGTFQEMGQSWRSTDPLKFMDKKNYQKRLEEASDKTGMNDSTVCGLAKLNGKDIAIAVMGFDFMGGSMGAVTGEKIAHIMDQALEKRIPAIVVCCSGGARMQEGIISLMQMAKTSASRRRLKEAGIPYISVLTDPSTGGAAASFAMLGDINIAEPKALICFAGPRVIEQSIRQVLPEGFQRSEFLLEHGFVDRIVHRHKMKAELSFFIEMFSPQ